MPLVSPTDNRRKKIAIAVVIVLLLGALIVLVVRLVAGEPADSTSTSSKLRALFSRKDTGTGPPLKPSNIYGFSDLDYQRFLLLLDDESRERVLNPGKGRIGKSKGMPVALGSRYSRLDDMNKVKENMVVEEGVLLGAHQHLRVSVNKDVLHEYTVCMEFAAEECTGDKATLFRFNGLEVTAGKDKKVSVVGDEGRVDGFADAFDGKKHLLCVSVDNTHTTLVLDGTQMGSGMVKTGQNGTGDLLVGYGSDTRMSVSNLIMLRSAPTRIQYQAMISTGSDPCSMGLDVLGHWPMDRAAGALIIPDVTGNSQPARLF